MGYSKYPQTSNICGSLVGNEIVDHLDVVGAKPVSAIPTTSSFSTEHLASMEWEKTTAWRDEKHLNSGIWCNLYKRFDSSPGFITVYVLREGHIVPSTLKGQFHRNKHIQW